MTTILATIFVFGLLVFVHELGHFLTAKAAGMRVDEFAIGFGPEIYQVREGETLYSLRLIPLGGYNKIAGMDPDEPNLDSRAFIRQSVPARLMVIAAGSAMNFLLPILLFFIVIFSSGVEKPNNEPILGTVMAERPAAAAGLLPGDRILSVEGVATQDWFGIVDTLRGRANQATTLQVEREGKQFAVVVTPMLDPKGERGVIGVMPQLTTLHPGFFESIGLAFEQVVYVTGAMIAQLSQMLMGKVDPEVSGPIGVAQMAGQVAQQGVIPLVQFAAFLSLNLGLINLLPIPALDGGHIITLLIEGVRGKPLTSKQLQWIQAIGVAVLLTLLIFATASDLGKLKLW